MPPTLTEEHALLFGQVASRAEDVLAVAAEGRWPGPELDALLGYVVAEVLQQVVDEERLLLPDIPDRPGLARSSRDHLRMRNCVEALERAAAGGAGWPVTRLAATTRDLLTLVKGHFAAEEALLAAARAPRPVPATAQLTGRPHEWYPLTEGPVVDLDALPNGQAEEAAVERLLRMRTGDRTELRSATSDLRDVWRRIDRIDPGGYGFAYLQDGPRRWAMRVTRRPVR